MVTKSINAHFHFSSTNGNTLFAYWIVATLISSLLFPLHVRKPLETQVINHLTPGKGYMSRAREWECVDFQHEANGGEVEERRSFWGFSSWVVILGPVPGVLWKGITSFRWIVYLNFRWLTIWISDLSTPVWLWRLAKESVEHSLYCGRITLFGLCLKLVEQLHWLWELEWKQKEWTLGLGSFGLLVSMGVNQAYVLQCVVLLWTVMGCTWFLLRRGSCRVLAAMWTLPAFPSVPGTRYYMVCCTFPVLLLGTARGPLLSGGGGSTEPV